MHTNTKLYIETEKEIEGDRERPKETKETVETVETRCTCKYKIIWRDRDQRRLERL